ncbi:2Fe-2S iron-sulfur cluster-binding protein [Pseudonocardia sp. CA-107938]|uniref:2Fe-2S iron-sulfur cluster-binding protein n=1 Tax=Pseudonocardia sp. CA-107938 TaxID=3240021 RepID=UPI003D921CB9
MRRNHSMSAGLGQTPHRLTTADEVEAIIGHPMSAITLKQVDVLDEGCRAVLEHSPLAGLGYRDADGTSRTTFVGGAPGFARVHSPTRFSFLLPDGSAHGPVSLLFLVPGVGETLRINGTVTRRKGAETVVDVQEAYVHCAQAVIRSRLWQPPVPAEPVTPVDGAGPLAAPGIAEFVAAAPFLALSSWDDAGGSDTSPRGDRQQVVRVLDDRTLILPDRKGNKRADTLHNLVRDDRMSFAALVPGRSGVLHVRGRGSITDDPQLLAPLALRGTPPHAALLIDVEHAEITGNDAVARSRVWAPATHLDRATAPDMGAVAAAHLARTMARSRKRVSAALVRLVMRVPGIGRLLRRVLDSSYRSELAAEGYDDVEIGGSRPGAPATDNPPRQVRIVDVRQETPSAATLVLADAGRPQPFDFRPGQFFTLTGDLAGRPVRRAYSASSAAGATQLEVTVKLVDGGRFSTHVHRGLRAGDRLALRGPSGSFHVDPAASHDLVLVAAGSGITPMMSIIRTVLAAPGDARVALLYSSRTAEEIIFADELHRLSERHPQRLSVTHVLTQEQGRLDAARLRGWLAEQRPAADTRYLTCGPDGLMDTFRQVLAELGVPEEKVHLERYASATGPVDASTAPQAMVVQDGEHALGEVVVEPGQTLLDAGLAAGLEMPFSCTVGNCGECMVRLRSGQVVMSRPNCLTPEQEADGFVLTCVGCPLSAVTVDVQAP